MGQKREGDRGGGKKKGKRGGRERKRRGRGRDGEVHPSGVTLSLTHQRRRLRSISCFEIFTDQRTNDHFPAEAEAFPGSPGR